MKKDLYNQKDYEWWANSAIQSARRIVPILIKSFDFSSVVDFGCAQGGWLSVFQEQGIEKIQGIDGDWVNPKELIIPELCFRCVDLSSYDHDPAEKYDLALCLEVAEHMEEKFSDQLIDNNNRNSTWWLRDGSFLRLKSIEFGYSVSDKLASKVNLSSARIYVTGTNLLTFSKFKLWDVEMGGNGLGYPIQQSANIGINLNF